MSGSSRIYCNEELEIRNEELWVSASQTDLNNGCAVMLNGASVPDLPPQAEFKSCPPQGGTEIPHSSLLIPNL